MPIKTLSKIKPIIFALAAFSLSGCASMGNVRDYANVAKAATTPTRIIGYDWQKILKGPPAQNNIQNSNELAIVLDLQKGASAQRMAQAVQDNGIDAFAIYRPIIGDGFGATQKPEIAALWTYAGRQMAANSNDAKEKFPRPRPFAASSDIKICISNPPSGSSYPSGHAAWGWVSAQILARLYPEKSSEILGRGIDYGYSRVVCGVHYPSDVSDGRLVGDIVLLALEKDPEFQRLLGIALKARKTD